MKKPILLLILISFLGIQIQAQYTFKEKVKNDCTEVKSQDQTGTCWSFATASFLESELIRMGKGKHNLSEMFVVKNVYKDKAKNYMLRQGKANFSQGSLSHDLLRVAAEQGVVPESAFSGLLDDANFHNHSEMESALKGLLDGVRKSKRLSSKWRMAFDAVMDVYMGATPKKFTYEGKSFTPKSFAKELGINAKDYISITSYTHHPFYETFVLEIPDNYSNGSFYNVPLDELQAIVDNAVNNGYTIAWDGDVSEKGFSAKEGIAVLPTKSGREDLFKKPSDEQKVSQDLRQTTFESYATTDDHLMHLVGTATDQNGTLYYLIKNSWGEISDYKGYLYMSKSYLQLKTVAIVVHKDAIPSDIRKKMGL